MTSQSRQVLMYCTARPHVQHEYKQAWQADVMTVGGKMFAMICTHKDGRPIITLKAEPARSLELRDAFEGVVIPGYYSNKTHWNSIFLDADFKELILYGLIDESYALVLESLPKKTRASLGGVLG